MTQLFTITTEEIKALSPRIKAVSESGPESHAPYEEIAGKLIRQCSRAKIGKVLKNICLSAIEDRTGYTRGDNPVRVDFRVWPEGDLQGPGEITAKWYMRLRVVDL